MATETGLVEVQVDDIVSVHPVSPDEPDLVGLVLRGGDIRQLFTVKPMPDNPGLTGGCSPVLPPGPKGMIPIDRLDVGATTYTMSDCSDTSTTSGTTGPDSTDDHICTRTADDD
jgi:hypothetical protein